MTRSMSVLSQFLNRFALSPLNIDTVCFKYSKNPSCIDLLLTNFKRSFLFNIFFFFKHKKETQEHTIDINLYRKITSAKLKHSNKTLLVSVILLFINKYYRKACTGKKKRTKINVK